MKLLVFLLTNLFLFFLIQNPAFAQISPGISISPSIIQLDLSHDPPQTDITYTNNTDAPVSLHISAKDFSAFDDQGRFDFLEGQDAKNYHYSLSSWIHFETTDITLEPHESKTIAISIDKDRLTIGGHYASILTEITEHISSQQVAVRAAAATLLFLRTGTTNTHEEAKINDIVINQDVFAFPDTISTRFENTGNVQITPYGLVTIKDPFGKVVASSIFNDASTITLPESIRKYTTTISHPNQFLLPGIYTTTIALHFGETNKQIKATKQFFTFGNALLILLGFIGLMIIGVVFLRKMGQRRQKRHMGQKGNYKLDSR